MRRLFPPSVESPFPLIPSRKSPPLKAIMLADEFGKPLVNDELRSFSAVLHVLTLSIQSSLNARLQSCQPYRQHVDSYGLRP